MSDPDLDPDQRDALVKELMEARRAVARIKRAKDGPAEERAHAAVDAAKWALGVRGPVWWEDGQPDFKRHMARNTPYGNWFANLH